MIQRFLFTVLKDGVEQITADPEIIDDLFNDVYGLTEEEATAIKTFWASKPPKVIHGYAPRDIDVPVFSIVLDNERESDTWLANDIGQEEDPDSPDYRADIKGSIWQHQYSVLVYTEHPDVTLYYYELAKSIILSGNDFFVDQGLFEIDLSGADMAPDERYIPQNLFARKLTFSCKRVFKRLLRGSQIGKATSVSGIHIDRSGSPSDAGDVETLVTFPPEYNGET